MREPSIVPSDEVTIIFPFYNNCYNSFVSHAAVIYIYTYI